MQHFGIIGKPLGHSMSKEYFEKRFAAEGVQADYTIHELDAVEDVVPLLDRLDGLNVTSPYKEAIMPYLDKIDETAREIGGVNVVYKRCGYNTDWIGAYQTMQNTKCKMNQNAKCKMQNDWTAALVLGTGGAARAVKFALEKLGMNVQVVSRNKSKGDLTYEELTEEVMKKCKVIANCTPLGMKPHEDEKPDIPYEWITKDHVLFDCIYNPEKTKFLEEGEKRGAEIVNGAEMFMAQAKEAWKKFRVES